MSSAVVVISALYYNISFFWKKKKKKNIQRQKSKCCLLQLWLVHMLKYGATKELQLPSWFCKRTVKALIRLHRCAGWSGPSLSAHARILYLKYCGNKHKILIHWLCHHQHLHLLVWPRKLDSSYFQFCECVHCLQGSVLLEFRVPRCIGYILLSASMGIDNIEMRDTEVNPLLIHKTSLTLCLFSTTKTWGRPRQLSWMCSPTGDQEVVGSTPAEVGNILLWRLIMK